MLWSRYPCRGCIMSALDDNLFRIFLNLITETCFRKKLNDKCKNVVGIVGQKQNTAASILQKDACQCVLHTNLTRTAGICFCCEHCCVCLDCVACLAVMWFSSSSEICCGVCWGWFDDTVIGLDCCWEILLAFTYVLACCCTCKRRSLVSSFCWYSTSAFARFWIRRMCPMLTIPKSYKSNVWVSFFR